MTPRRAVRGAVGIGAAVVVGELVVRTGLVGASAIPAPSSVLWSAAGLLVDSEFLSAVGRTLEA